MADETHKADAPGRSIGLPARLCVAMLRASLGDESAAEERLWRTDFHQLIAFANSHRVAAALAAGLRNLNPDVPFAQGLLQMVEALQEFNERQNSELLASLEKVCRLLEKHSIRNAALKGAAFLVDQPEARRWRSISDIDLLVSPSDVQRAAAVLLKNGYRAALPEDGYRMSDHQHYPPLIPPNASHFVELHTRLVWNRKLNPFDAQDILHRSTPSVGRPVRIPACEHRIAHLIIHCQLADKFMAARRLLLKDVLDLAHLSARPDIDWQRIDHAFDAISQRPAMSGFLMASQKLMGESLIPVLLDISDGSVWAQRAVSNLMHDKSDKGLMALDVMKDYLNRILLQPGGPSLAVKTLIDPQRRRNLINTHMRKWRG